MTAVDKHEGMVHSSICFLQWGQDPDQGRTLWRGLEEHMCRLCQNQNKGTTWSLLILRWLSCPRCVPGRWSGRWAYPWWSRLASDCTNCRYTLASATCSIHDPRPWELLPALVPNAPRVIPHPVPPCSGPGSHPADFPQPSGQPLIFALTPCLVLHQATVAGGMSCLKCGSGSVTVLIGGFLLPWEQN